MAMIVDQYFVYGYGGVVYSLDVPSGKTRRWEVEAAGVMAPDRTKIPLETRTRVEGKVSGQLRIYDLGSGSADLISEQYDTLFADYTYYQGGILFATDYTSQDESGAIVWVDARSSMTGNRLVIPGADNSRLALVALSPDKRLLSVRGNVSGNEYGSLTYDIEAGVVVGVSRGWSPEGFLSNSVVYRRAGGLLLELRDIRGNSLESVRLLVGDAFTEGFCSLTPELRYLLLRKSHDKDEDYLIYDLKPLRDYLEARNYVVHPTKGIANASGVRVRENANLQSETIGTLTAGEELEVVDRSGTKVSVGDRNEYWYRVRRGADGLDGWVYGAYIDVDRDQPEPVPTSTVPAGK